MLPDPVTVAANSPTPALVLAVIRSDGYGTERKDRGGNGYTVVTNHSPPGKSGTRHYVKITQVKDATNPYTSALQSISASVSLSISAPAWGFANADLVALYKALKDYIDDSEVTPTNIINGES